MQLLDKSNLSASIKKRFISENDDSPYFYNQRMNISPHLLIDALILSTALTITLVLRAKGNAVRKEKEMNDY